MPISIGDLKPSKSIVFNGEIYTIIQCEHVKLGRGSAFCHTKLRNIKTLQVLTVTIRDSDKVEEAFIERRKLQYTYQKNSLFHFMDLETYDDLVLDSQRMKGQQIWLKDNLQVMGLFYNDEFINLEFPKTVALKVMATEPGIKGNTAKAVAKPAKLETGTIIGVPLFINTGDIIKVDTIKKEYISRI